MMSIFKKKTLYGEDQPQWNPPQVPTKYPKWTFVKVDGTNDYYLILDKTKMKFISERAFLSWGKPALRVSEKGISGYMKWKDVGFAPGTVLKSVVDSSHWFITGKDPLAPERRLITTPDFFTTLGFDLRWIYVVSLEELDFHQKGENI